MLEFVGDDLAVREVMTVGEKVLSALPSAVKVEVGQGEGDRVPLTVEERVKVVRGEHECVSEVVVESVSRDERDGGIVLATENDTITVIDTDAVKSPDIEVTPVGKGEKVLRVDTLRVPVDEKEALPDCEGEEDDDS